jgi:hypothetical protein
MSSSRAKEMAPNRFLFARKGPQSISELHILKAQRPDEVSERNASRGIPGLAMEDFAALQPCIRVDRRMRSKAARGIEPISLIYAAIGPGQVQSERSSAMANSIALLPYAAPSVIRLSTSTSTATAPAPTPALRLKGAVHLVAINGTRKSECRGSPFYLHVKGYFVSSDGSCHRRRSAGVLKRAAQFGAILLDLHGGLLSIIPALP